MTDNNYDDQGRWIRTDRPELLSDRLGYLSERGDRDWPQIKAARERRAREAEGDNTDEPS